MTTLLLVWLALLAALTALTVRGAGYGALTLTYFLALSLIHVPGVLAYLDPMLAPATLEETRVGFEMTLIGLASFVIGAAIAVRTGRRRKSARPPDGRAGRRIGRLGRRWLMLGVVSYFVLLPVSGLVPSGTAIVSALAGSASV